MYSYQQERQRLAEQWAQAPRQCPHCHTPINQQQPPYYEKPHPHCGRDACRAKAHRANRAEQTRQRREQYAQHIEQYAAQLPEEQAAIIRESSALLTRFASGYDLMWQLCHLIEMRACKHDRIGVLEANAKAANDRADEAHAYNEELKALYERRIEELEKEIRVYQALERTIHGVAERQLARKGEQDPIAFPKIDGDEEDE